MSDETTTEHVAEIEEQAEPLQIREGRWRTRAGEVCDITPTPEEDGRARSFPWWDHARTWRIDGRVHSCNESQHDLVDYLGPIPTETTTQAKTEEQPQPLQVREGRWRTRDGNFRHVTPTPHIDGRARGFPWWDAAYGQVWMSDGRYYPEGASGKDLVQYLGPILTVPEQVNELQAQVAFLKGREVTLATRLQQEKEVTTRLRGEVAEQAETIRRLQIELDAAQQVPADSPELRQLRADLAEITQDRDTYRHAHELLMNDVNATHQRTKAMTVEAIAEWLEPIRAVDHPNLSNETLQHLPQIMRHLTGLDSQAID